MRYFTNLLILMIFLASGPAVAQDDAAIRDIRALWQGCTEVLEGGAGWLGWHRDFGNGYGDEFEFYDRRDTGQPSVLKQTFMIDGIALESDTSCYREDGTLAFVFTTLASPNMAQGTEGPGIVREGRLYFDAMGEPLRILEQITRDGKKVADADNDTYQLARGCDMLEMHLDIAAVVRHLDSELGDIDGKRPPFEVSRYAWCSHEGE